MGCNSPGSTHHRACDCRESAHAEEVARLRAENARLREALEEIREWAGGLGWLGSPQDERVEAECLAILARLALAAAAKTGGA